MLSVKGGGEVRGPKAREAGLTPMKREARCETRRTKQAWTRKWRGGGARFEKMYLTRSILPVSAVQDMIYELHNR